MQNLKYLLFSATDSNIGKISHSFLNRHLTKTVGGNVSNFTQKLLKIFGNLLFYRSKQTKCKNTNIDMLKVECVNCDGQYTLPKNAPQKATFLVNFYLCAAYKLKGKLI